jgi:hypothetical protein
MVYIVDWKEISPHLIFIMLKPGVSGGWIYNITSSYNPFGVAFGSWDETSTPIFDAAPLMYNNEVYLNVHSDQHPSGEIRGNLGTCWSYCSPNYLLTRNLVITSCWQRC